MKIIWEITYDVYLDETGEGDPIAEMELLPEEIPTYLRNQIEQLLRSKALERCDVYA